jgi:polar amino acid transport system permease protein
MSWDSALFFQVLFSPVVVWAAWTTIWVASLSQALGTVMGTGLAPMMMARSPILRFIAWFYLWVFRGTPLLAQILFFYAVLPQLGVRIGVLETGILALSLNEAARMSEVVRSGLLSVADDQREAAASLGLSKTKTFFLVVLPQAMRAILPPLGNNFSYMIKATSLLSAISFSELLRTSQQLAQSTAHPLEVYLVAALWYLAIISLVTIGQRALEHRVNRAHHQRNVRERAPAPEAARRPAVVHPIEHEPQAAALITARGISKQLGQTRAVDNVDLDVYPGEVVIILGPSGSGKSTLLRCLNHLEVPDEGLITFEGEPFGARLVGGKPRALPERMLDRQRQRLAMVFQRFNLFNHLTALENITRGLVRVQRVAPKQARERAMELLARFRLDGLEDKYPSELSGGQKQRVAIARVLSMQPRAILFDEPTSALDPEMVGEVLEAMRQLAREGKTMVIVTHEIAFARAVADRVVIMESGRIIEQGPAAAVFDNPGDPRTRAFLASLSSPLTAFAA